MKAKAQSKADVAAVKKDEKAMEKSEAAAAAIVPPVEKPAAATSAAKPAKAPVKPGTDKPKIYGKPPQKTYMSPRGGKGSGGGALRQMRSQRGR